MPELAYVNGYFGPISTASVSIEDRGFQFADGVYEVFAAFGTHVFREVDHFDRLCRSLSLIDINVDLESLGLQSIIREGIARAGFDRTMVYCQVTRGTQPRSHVYALSIAPTIVATFKQLPEVDPQLRSRGVSVVTVEDTRWSCCEIKSIGLLPNVLAKNRAMRDGYDDAIFISPSGEVREGSSSNVFVVRNGALQTPATSPTILHGVTRGYILECARKAGVAIVEGPLSVEEFAAADEAFLSSTTLDVLAITRLNGRPIADGRVGLVTRQLHHAFLEGLPACSAKRPS